jgi:hypothetical protein
MTLILPAAPAALALTDAVALDAVALDAAARDSGGTSTVIAPPTGW